MLRNAELLSCTVHTSAEICAVCCVAQPPVPELSLLLLLQLECAFDRCLQAYLLYGTAACARTIAAVTSAPGAAADGVCLPGMYLRVSGVFFDRWSGRWFDRAMMTLVGEGQQERRSLREGLTTS